jgi:DNA-binding transcriptional LysR family regulator
LKTELELRQLRVFVTVVELGAHARAARSLGISQSTVSETLGALERTLGTTLFRKTSKGSTLTPAGDALLPYARQLLSLTSELMTQLSKASAQLSTTLVVSAVESVSTYLLPSRLSALRERWPNTRLEVNTAICMDIRESVAVGKSDLGLVLEGESGIDDESILSRARLVIFAHPSHPLARRRATPEQLRDCDFYMSDASGNYHQVLRQYFEAAQVAQPRTQALGTVEGVKRGILEGGSALGVLPAHAVERELHDRQLVEVRANPPLPGLVLRAVLSSTGSAPPVVDDLIRSLRTLPLTE